MPNRIVHMFQHSPVLGGTPEIIDPFVTLAQHLDEVLESGPEKNAALRKLLEACDQAVRARIIDLDNQARNEKIAAATDVLFPMQSGARE